MARGTIIGWLAPHAITERRKAMVRWTLRNLYLVELFALFFEYERQALEYLSSWLLCLGGSL